MKDSNPDYFMGVLHRAAPLRHEQIEHPHQEKDDVGGSKGRRLGKREQNCPYKARIARNSGCPVMDLIVPGKMSATRDILRLYARAWELYCNFS